MEFISGIGDKISGVISKINPFKNLFRTIDTTIIPTVNTGGIAPLSLDNVALSGSYYNSNTRSSVRANDIIRQVNGGVDSINQTTALNSIVSKFTQELNNIKSENNNSMNVIAKALESMSDAIKGLKLEAVIDGEKLTGRLNKIDGKNLNLYERWNGVS